MNAEGVCGVGDIVEVLRLSERRIQQLVRRGIIPKVGWGRYEFVPAVQGYVRYLEERKRADEPTIDYRRERARLTKAQADRAETEAAEVIGEVVSVEQVKRNIAVLFAEIRAAVLKIPDRVVPALVGNMDEREIKAVLSREIDSVLTALADSDVVIEPSEDEERDDGIGDKLG